MYYIFSQIGDTVTTYAKTKSRRVADDIVTDLINNFDVANSNKYFGEVISYFWQYVDESVPVTNDRDATTKRIVKHIKAENARYPHYERQTEVH